MVPQSCLGYGKQFFLLALCYKLYLGPFKASINRVWGWGGLGVGVGVGVGGAGCGGGGRVG